MSIHGEAFDRAQALYDAMEPPICECPDDCEGCEELEECCGECSWIDDEAIDWEKEQEYRDEMREERWERNY